MTPEAPKAPNTIEGKRISEIASRITPEYKAWGEDKAGYSPATAVQEKLEEMLNKVLQELGVTNIQVTEDDIDAFTHDSDMPDVEDGTLHAFSKQIKFTCSKHELGPLHFQGNVEKFLSDVITEILLRKQIVIT